MATMNQIPLRMRFFVRLFPLPFILVGLVTLFFGLRGVYRAKESTGWPSAEGTVQNSTVEYQSSNEGGGTYHAAVLYQFQVDGVTHCGNTIAFGDYGSSNPCHAQDIVNRYPKGKAVSVYYRSGDPNTCVLEPGLQGQAWFLPGFGLAFLAAGSFVAVVLPWAMGKPKTGTEPAEGMLAG